MCQTNTWRVHLGGGQNAPETRVQLDVSWRVKGSVFKAAPPCFVCMLERRRAVARLVPPSSRHQRHPVLAVLARATPVTRVLRCPLSVSVMSKMKGWQRAAAPAGAECVLGPVNRPHPISLEPSRVPLMTVERHAGRSLRSSLACQAPTPAVLNARVEAQERHGVHLAASCCQPKPVHAARTAARRAGAFVCLGGALHLRRLCTLLGQARLKRPALVVESSQPSMHVAAVAPGATRESLVRPVPGP